MNKTVILIVAFLIIIIAFGLGFYFAFLRLSESEITEPPKETGEVTSFEECVAAGNPVMESYPRQCRANGRIFVEEIRDLKYDEILDTGFDEYNDLALDYDIYGCQEPMEKEYVFEKSENQKVTKYVNPDGVIFTHEINYVCCADLELEIASVEKKQDLTLVKLTEKNAEQMCDCVCDYEIEMDLAPLEPGKYAVEMWGIEDGEMERNMLWREEFEIEESIDSTDKVENGAQLANPASVYCEEQGGELEIRDFESGQVGFCRFDDGSECEEWAFYRGECKMSERYCKDLCGDGECQEVVCLGTDCPCAETKQSCPQDCD